MTYPKRLIEVDLPIKQISAHARREKSIRHGHISTLHIWWARRPLAACRAVVCAALWPDPADPNCPRAFREAAARELKCFAARACSESDLASHCSTEAWKRWKGMTSKTEPHFDADDAMQMEQLRHDLLSFIADFSNWDNSTQTEYLATSRALTQAAHEALGGEAGTRPLVVDPFAGGGSIPLEALRVGADAFASDLNPVAVLLNKVVLEYIPKYGQSLADEVRKWGEWIKREAERELAEFYPKDPDGSTPIAYLWARTVQCEGPSCGAQVPLIRSLWLSKKEKRSVALRIVPDTKRKCVDFEIVERTSGKWHRHGEPETGVKLPRFEGTVARGNATCPCCRFTTPVESVRRQLKTRRGGANDARLFCVVITKPNVQGRFYRLPTEADLDASFDAVREISVRSETRRSYNGEQLRIVPDEPLPPQGTLGFRVQLYGMESWGDLFQPRQLLALTTLSRLTTMVKSEVGQDGAFVDAIQSCLALAVDRCANQFCSLSKWNTGRELVDGVFARQALPMLWDFGEINPLSRNEGFWMTALEWIISVLEAQRSEFEGRAEEASATQSPLPDNAAAAFITDPPYYDSVPYADLSDFFYVWLKRALPSSRAFFDELSPKDAECIVDESRGKNQNFFEQTIKQAMVEGCRVLAPNGVGVVVFAHKSTAGWETLLQAMVDAGWTITGSWPIDTEMGTRLRAQDSAALASSIHLVVRPRENPDGSLKRNVGDWRDVLGELPVRIGEWMPRLAREGVVGADAIFACLGPALEIFSRYASVEKVSGEVVTLGEYLVYVWAAVAREALSNIFVGADTSAFEADARLTAMWLWTLRGADAAGPSDESDDDEATTPRKVGAAGGYALDYDGARKIAQGLGVDLESLSGVVEVKGDKARLLSVEERARVFLGKGALPKPRRAAKPSSQLSMFAEAEDEPDWVREVAPVSAAPTEGGTLLDRVHQSMILFGDGHGDSLARFLKERGVGRDEKFWSLAQALSALYPPASVEKRWIDGVLGRKKGLGF